MAHSSNSSRTVRQLVTGLSFAILVWAGCVQLADFIISTRKTTIYPRNSFSGAHDKIVNSSKIVNFVNASKQLANRTEAASVTGPRPRRESGDDYLPLERKTEQSCPVHDAKKEKSKQRLTSTHNVPCCIRRSALSTALGAFHL